jgi:hypothetical protein
MQTNRKLITVFVLAIVAFMVSGSAASANTATIPKLPTCTDPTGHNLPCMMNISTLPAPPNALQCQETSGQILACSYATQNLSNGEQIVVITVYVPANFVFSSPTVIKVIVHETTTTGTTSGATGGGKTLSHKLLVGIGVAKNPIVRGNIQTITVTVADSKKTSMKVAGAVVNGRVTYVTAHQEPLTGVTDDQGIYSHHWRISGDAIPGKFKVEVHASANGKAGSATTTFTVIPKINTTSLANATIPINVTNTTSPNLTNQSNTSAMIFKPPSNTSTAIQPSNTSIPTSGGKGKATSCAAGNCTTGTTPPTVDCTKNPNDPSCTQTLTPSTTTPTTKTCSDGSVIDASATCPTQSTPPPSTQGPDNNNPSASSNGPPSSSDNGNNNPPPSDKGSSDKR